MKPTRIAIKNYRSIGPAPIEFNLATRCNLLIGANNSGKSNVIRGLKRFLDACRSFPTTDTIDGIDFHLRDSKNPPTFEVEFALDDSIPWLSGIESASFVLEWHSSSLRIVDSSLLWLTDRGQASAILAQFQGQRFNNSAARESVADHLRPHLQKMFEPIRTSVPPNALIPEFRKISTGNEYGLDGTRLIERLATFAHPMIGRDEDQLKFDSIQGFMRELVGIPDAILEVSHQDPQIIVRTGSLRLPLTSYGTGIHELLIMVTAVLSVNQHIVFIEEPEIHLHPSLQRRLLAFLLRETEHTFIISTHSSALINAAPDETSICHIQMREGIAHGNVLASEEASIQAIRDLGVRPSDLLLSEGVVWVEGPTDRTYLRRWLSLVAPDLVENRDFVIMFYGGRLLSHVAATLDRVATDLIRLLKISTNAAIVMDSDRADVGDSLNSSKMRVIAECEHSGTHCWVTEGREVENYLASEVIARAVKGLTGRAISIEVAPFERLGRSIDAALEAAGGEALCYSDDKVGFSKVFADEYTSEDVKGALLERITELAERIRSWKLTS